MRTCPPAPGPHGWRKRLISSDGAGLPQSDLIASTVIQHHPTPTHRYTLQSFDIPSGCSAALLRLIASTIPPPLRLLDSVSLWTLGPSSLGLTSSLLDNTWSLRAIGRQLSTPLRLIGHSSTPTNPFHAIRHSAHSLNSSHPYNPQFLPSTPPPAKSITPRTPDRGECAATDGQCAPLSSRPPPWVWLS